MSCVKQLCVCYTLLLFNYSIKYIVITYHLSLITQYTIRQLIGTIQPRRTNKLRIYFSRACRYATQPDQSLNKRSFINLILFFYHCIMTNDRYFDEI